MITTPKHVKEYLEAQKRPRPGKTGLIAIKQTVEYEIKQRAANAFENVDFESLKDRRDRNIEYDVQARFIKMSENFKKYYKGQFDPKLYGYDELNKKVVKEVMQKNYVLLDDEGNLIKDINAIKLQRSREVDEDIKDAMIVQMEA
jgi:hypothetical protein